MLESAKLNILATVGVPFEIIAFDNSSGQKGICQIYNEGALAANYDILCYMHEDLDIKTLSWGKQVVDLFNGNKNIGVVGVVGSAYKSYAPSGWAAPSHNPKTIHCNYLQSFKRAKKPPFHYYMNPDQVEIAKVVCVDGMWFCTTKSIAIECKFDQSLLNGFHCYDLDYCLNVSRKYDVVVSFNILMEHFSEGGYSQGWFDDTIKLHEKWADTLPRSVIHVSNAQQRSLEKRSYKGFLEKMIALDYSFQEMVSFLNTYYQRKDLNTMQYIKLLYYSLKFLYKKK